MANESKLVPGVDQVPKRHVELCPCDRDSLVFADVELLEDGLVEEPSLLRRHAPVELLRVGEQQERILQQLSPNGQLFTAIGHLSAQLVSLALDRPEPHLDLVRGQPAIGGQVEQVLLLLVQALQLGGQPLLHQPGGTFLLVEGLTDGLSQPCGQVGWEADGGVRS